MHEPLRTGQRPHALRRKTLRFRLCGTQANQLRTDFRRRRRSETNDLATRTNRRKNALFNARKQEKRAFRRLLEHFEHCIHRTVVHHMGVGDYNNAVVSSERLFAEFLPNHAHLFNFCAAIQLVKIRREFQHLRFFAAEKQQCGALTQKLRSR